MTRLLAVAVLLGLLVSGTALAARGEPKRAIKPADQARAKAMLLKKSDLPGFKATRPSGGGTSGSGDFYCKALDESDLTLTGDATSLEFEAGFLVVSSSGQVYQTLANSNTSWRRGTSSAGRRCLRQAFASEFTKQGGRLRSFKQVAFPRVGQRSIAFRFAARSEGIDVFIDLVVIKHTRAHSGVVFISALVPFPKGEQVRLARAIASRMATAMRGA